MKSSKLKAWIIAPFLVLVLAGGVLTPTTSCACDPDPLRDYLVYLHVVINRSLPACRSLQMSREAVLEVVPMGTTKQELLRINSEIRDLNGGKRAITGCKWTARGDVYQCDLQVGTSWFDAVQKSVSVRFEFGRALRLDHLTVTEHESFFGRETVREI